MDLTVFRQAQKVRVDGQTIYKGEDALPFVDEHILLVADGLGGASAIRHQSLKREMFDSEKLFDVLFGGVFEEVGEDIKRYVVQSFYEFLSIADRYFDNINNIKKSGYFGSRIVSAIFLYLAKKFIGWTSSYRTEFFAMTDEQNKKIWLNDIGEYFTSQLKEMLLKVSQNANLVYESSFSGLALLGTTLCATIVDEQEDYVDALYFVAGDSRPYLWSSSGLQQVVADQERADGGMTNYIKANGDFKIEVKLFKFKTPCILFNASDGVFDSQKFKISQMALEKLLAETIMESDSVKEVEEKLEKFFEENGTHDDSSTIALKSFGFKDYESLKEFANNRFGQLTLFLNDMGDLLERNYSEELEQFDNQIIFAKKKLCNALWELPTVVSYCKRNVQENIVMGGVVSEQFAEEYARAENSIIKNKNEYNEKERELLEYIKTKVIYAKANSESNPFEYDVNGEVLSDECRRLLGELLGGSLKVNDLQISTETANTFQYLLDEYKSCADQIQADNLKIEDLLLKEARTTWLEVCSHENDVLKFALENQLITSADYDILFEQYPISNYVEKADLEKKAKLQNELLDAYDETYFALIQGD